MSGKDIPPISGIGYRWQLQTSFFRAFSGNLSENTPPKYPFPEKMGTRQRMRPPNAIEWGGGGIAIKSHCIGVRGGLYVLFITSKFSNQYRTDFGV